MMNTYFVSYDTHENRNTLTEELKKIGSILPYAGGWLIRSDIPVTQLHAQLSALTSGQSVVIPVDTQKVVSLGILNTQARNFIQAA